MEQKKKNKSFDIVFGIFVVMVVVISVIYARTRVQPEVTIDGKTLKVGMKVQDLVDAGFSVGTSFTGFGGADLDAQSKVPGESYSTKRYYVFLDGEYTNVDFMVYNSKVDSCDFKESRIYSFSFGIYKFSEVDVLVNGIDLDGMKKEDAVLAFEEKGIKFDEKDKEEFFSGESSIIFGKSGDYSFMLESDYEKKGIESVEVKRKL